MAMMTDALWLVNFDKLRFNKTEIGNGVLLEWDAPSLDWKEK